MTNKPYPAELIDYDSFCIEIDLINLAEGTNSKANASSLDIEALKEVLIQFNMSVRGLTTIQSQEDAKQRLTQIPVDVFTLAALYAAYKEHQEKEWQAYADMLESKAKKQIFVIWNMALLIFLCPLTALAIKFS